MIKSTNKEKELYKRKKQSQVKKKEKNLMKKNGLNNLMKNIHYVKFLKKYKMKKIMTVNFLIEK